MLNKELIYKKLNTKFIGRNIYTYDMLNSTQDEIKKKEDIANGSVIIAEIQSNGKGTHGRKWFTDEKNKNIAMTFVLYPNCEIKRIENITVIIAKCIVDSIYKLYNIKLDIKSPNDIVVNNKKIGGILTETKIVGQKVRAIYVGIGLNVLQEKFNAQLQDIASSIKNEFGIECVREDIISMFFNIFEKYYIKIIEEIDE